MESTNFVLFCQLLPPWRACLFTVEELAVHSHDFVTAPILFANVDTNSDSCIKPNTTGTCALDIRPTTTVGGNAPHENRMPYLAVYIWNRTR